MSRTWEKRGARFKSYRDAQHFYRRTIHRARLLPYRRPAAREGTGTSIKKGTAEAVPFRMPRNGSYFAFLYFSQATRIAMAPLGMIMKLVEPVRLGTSMNRMLIIRSGQTAVPMFFR